jgi:hypothetical protein
MAEVFDNQALEVWRADLCTLIRASPALDWLLLTKRPQLIVGMLPSDWGLACYPTRSLPITRSL